MKKQQNYFKWIQTALQATLKQKTFTQTLQDDETRFDTSNYELDRPLPKGKIKK